MKISKKKYFYKSFWFFYIQKVKKIKQLSNFFKKNTNKIDYKINFVGLKTSLLNNNKLFALIRKNHFLIKSINLLLIFKNSSKLVRGPNNLFKFNKWVFQLKKNFKTLESNKIWLQKRFNKLTPWKKKTYKQRWWEEQLFFNERQRKVLPFWVKKQVWLQYWYETNLYVLNTLIYENKIRLNIFKKFNIFYKLLTPNFVFTNITKLYFNNFLFFIFNLTNLWLIKISILVFFKFSNSNKLLLFSRGGFNFWDKYKSMSWKNFKWNILFFNKIMKGCVLNYSFLFKIIATIDSNNFNKKIISLANIISYKKLNSNLKQSLNLPKYIAHSYNYFNKINQNYYFNLINFVKLNNNKKNKNFNENLFLYKKLMGGQFGAFSSLKFLFLNTKWFKLYHNNRQLIKFFLFRKKKKQYFLTRLLSSLTKQPFSLFFNNLELNLVNLLVRGRFALSYQHAKDLLFLGYVYINSKKTTNFLYLLKPNDYIQIIFDETYLINYQYFYAYLKNKQKHIKYCFQRWYNNRFDFYKQHTKRFPSWLLKLIFFKLDSPLYLEIDYSTLTMVIIRNPFFFYELNLYLYKFINLYFIRLYNWKYII